MFAPANAARWTLLSQARTRACACLSVYSSMAANSSRLCRLYGRRLMRRQFREDQGLVRPTTSSPKLTSVFHAAEASA